MNSELLEQYIKFLHDSGLRNARKDLTGEVKKRRIDYKLSGQVRLAEMNELMYEIKAALDMIPDKSSKEYTDLLNAFNSLENTAIPMMYQMPNATDYFYTNNRRFNANQTVMGYGLRMASTLILNHYDNFLSGKKTKIERLDDDNPVIDIDLDHFKEVISEPIMFAYTSAYGEDIKDITEIPDSIDRHLDTEKELTGKSYSRVEYLKALINIYKEVASVNKKSITELRKEDLEHYL